MDISAIFSAIKEMKNTSHKIYIGKGMIEEFYCIFQESASMEQIEAFESKNNILLPEDYKEFLLLSNGLELYQSTFEIFGLQQIQDMIETNVYKEGFLIIAYINGDYVGVNCEEISSGKYLYAGDECSVDEFIALGVDFETFLDRIVMTNANVYWDWFTNRKYYNFSS